MLTLEDVFPPYALRISCGPVELRVLRDEDLPELVELVRGGIQVPGLPMPFLTAWHEEPFAPGGPDGFPTTSLRWWWMQRATFAPEEWRLALTVRREGELVGMQDLHAEEFAHTRRVLTGSWLGAGHQGRGVGTLMRQLVVGFAFDELGADWCESGYIEGNHASAAVSRKVGYVDNGRRRIVQHTRQGKVGVDEQRVVVTPATFVRPDERVAVDGAEVLRRFLAIDRPVADQQGR
jgi:RimJ/RimL family protein N-acetyltransferase